MPPAVAYRPRGGRAGGRSHWSEECDDDRGPLPETRKDLAANAK
jgi:hypothetical protein